MHRACISHPYVIIPFSSFLALHLLLNNMGAGWGDDLANPMQICLVAQTITNILSFTVQRYLGH